jgi:hypothetical protein
LTSIKSHWTIPLNGGLYSTASYWTYIGRKVKCKIKMKKEKGKRKKCKSNERENIIAKMGGIKKEGA